MKSLFLMWRDPDSLRYKGVYTKVESICKSVYLPMKEAGENTVDVEIKIEQENDIKLEPIFECQTIKDELNCNETSLYQYILKRLQLSL